MRADLCSWGLLCSTGAAVNRWQLPLLLLTATTLRLPPLLPLLAAACCSKAAHRHGRPLTGVEWMAARLFLAAPGTR